MFVHAVVSGNWKRPCLWTTKCTDWLQKQFVSKLQNVPCKGFILAVLVHIPQCAGLPEWIVPRWKRSGVWTLLISYPQTLLSVRILQHLADDVNPHLFRKINENEFNGPNHYSCVAHDLLTLLFVLLHPRKLNEGSRLWRDGWRRGGWSRIHTPHLRLSACSWSETQSARVCVGGTGGSWQWSGRCVVRRRPPCRRRRTSEPLPSERDSQTSASITGDNASHVTPLSDQDRTTVYSFSKSHPTEIERNAN